MSNAAIQTQQIAAETMLRVISGGDTSSLTPEQRIAYYNARCEAAGLDPRAQPFQFVRLNGREVLYALKAASDQLAAKHKVKLEIVSQATEDGIRVVTVRAVAGDGRQTDEVGAVPVKGLQGEALCNAMMKCVTKAKRRAILSLTGLGMLDETEIESIPHAEPAPAPRPVVEVLPAPEAKPAPSPATAKPAAKPQHIVAAWELAKEIYGDAKRAAEPWKIAVQSVIGSRPSDTLSEAEALDVEAILRSKDSTIDIPF